MKNLKCEWVLMYLYECFIIFLSVCMPHWEKIEYI